MCLNYVIATFLHITKSTNINILVCYSSWSKCLLMGPYPRGHFIYLTVFKFKSVILPIITCMKSFMRFNDPRTSSVKSIHSSR